LIAIIRSNEDNSKVETELREANLSEDVTGDVYGDNTWPEDGYDEIEHNGRNFISVVEPGVFEILPNGEIVAVPTDLEEVEDDYFEEEEVQEVAE